MNYYIQSKSGDLNASIKTELKQPLKRVLGKLREDGGYPAKFQKEVVFVPFEEIQYIREATEDDFV